MLIKFFFISFAAVSVVVVSVSVVVVVKFVAPTRLPSKFTLERELENSLGYKTFYQHAALETLDRKHGGAELGMHASFVRSNLVQGGRISIALDELTDDFVKATCFENGLRGRVDSSLPIEIRAFYEREDIVSICDDYAKVINSRRRRTR